MKTLLFLNISPIVENLYLQMKIYERTTGNDSVLRTVCIHDLILMLLGTPLEVESIQIAMNSFIFGYEDLIEWAEFYDVESYKQQDLEIRNLAIAIYYFLSGFLSEYQPHNFHRINSMAASDSTVIIERRS